MFEEFYHLTQNPFQINTDPRFLWLGEKHKEALTILQYGIMGNKSFLLLTGDVGTGKTTLINALLKGQPDDTLIATIQDPDLATLDLYNYIAYAFGMGARYDSKGKFLVGFRKFLTNNYYNGKKVLLIIDEAQRTKQEILEDIRSLSNIEIDGQKLINIFFVGQNEFNDILMQDANKAIRQRITISYNIKPLTRDEVGKYIQFRLFRAGAKAKIFKKDALKEIHKFTGGYPRMINILCDRCLLTGFVLGKKTIGRKIVHECCAEIDFSKKITTNRCQEKPQRPLIQDKGQVAVSRPLYGRPAIALTIALVFILSGAAWLFHDSIRMSYRQHFIANVNVPQAAAAIAAGKLYSSAKEQGGEQDSQPLAPQSKQTAGAEPPSSSFRQRQGAGQDGKTMELRAREAQVPLLTEAVPGTMQVFFKSDSISPSSADVEALKRFANSFLTLEDGHIVIRGYADRTGGARYNRKLAKFRADAVKTLLEGTGIDASRITTRGLISTAAAELPKAGQSPAETARRVELQIVLPGSTP